MSFNKLLPSVPLLVAIASAGATDFPQHAQDLKLNMVSGDSITLRDYAEKKPVYLKFWATWCQPCRKEMPHFQEIQAKYGTSIKVIGVNLGINDSVTDVEKTVREFGLTMPMAIDKGGDLAQAFRVKGTPYHLLFDQNLNLVHEGHEATTGLDDKLMLLSQRSPVGKLDLAVLKSGDPDLTIAAKPNQITALFFTATWCDWYLADIRPTVSRQCVDAQKEINKLAEKYPTISWNVIVSRLWTGDDDLQEYRKKYGLKMRADIDKNNSLFHKHQVTDYPTLVLVKDGKVLLSTRQIVDNQVLAKTLGSAVM